MSKLCGIYLLTHIETGRKYVGQSRRIAHRWKQHERATAKNKIGAAIRAYGWASFSAEIIQLCEPHELNACEARWVLHYQCVAPLGFNLTTGGDHTAYSDETRKKIGDANRRRVVTEETRAKMSKAQSNRSATHRENISKAKTGRPISQEHAAALRKAAKDHAATNIPRLAEINRGSKRSDECRAKIAEANRKRVYSQETLAKMSAAQRGRGAGVPLSSEHRAKVSASLKGHRHSAETIEKLRAAARARSLRNRAPATA